MEAQSKDAQQEPSVSIDAAYDQAQELAQPAEAPTEDVQVVAEDLPADAAAGTIASPLVEGAYAQAQHLAEPSAEPTAQASLTEEEGLTEAGEFVQAVATGEVEQPGETGQGVASGIDPELEQAERDEQNPLERYDLLTEETGADTQEQVEQIENR